MAEFGDLDVSDLEVKNNKPVQSIQTSTTNTNNRQQQSSLQSTSNTTQTSTQQQQSNIIEAIKTEPIDNNDTDIHDFDGTVSAYITYVQGSIIKKTKNYENKYIDIRIGSSDLTLDNRNVMTRQLWGGPDYYTDDSDIVAILRHNADRLPSSIYITHEQPHFNGVSVICKIIATRDKYPSYTINDYTSRAWNNKYDRYTLQFIKASIIDDNNNDSNTLTPANTTIPVHNMYEKDYSNRRVKRDKGRYLNDITLLYDIFNQPTLKYNLSLISDRGLDEYQWTYYRLKNECFYFCNVQNTCYELAKEQSNTSNKQIKRNDNTSVNVQYDKYRWSQIKITDNTNTIQSLYRAINSSTPVNQQYTTVLHDNLDSDEIEWSNNYVIIRRNKYDLHTFRAKPITT